MSFFDQLEDIATADIPIRERYYVLRDTFKRIVNQAIALNSINFIGLFAKLDYIIKQHDIPAEDAILIHDTRKVLNAIHDTADNDLTTSLPYDIKATAQLVSAINGRMSIPQSLARLFPKKDRKTRWSKIDINMLRVVVNS